MTQHLTEVRLESQDLPARMAITHPGQITWASLTAKTQCATCRHFRDSGKKTGKDKGKGRCALVKAMHRKEGALFISEAPSCPKYEQS